jgi:hypothetical protein
VHVNKALLRLSFIFDEGVQGISKSVSILLDYISKGAYRFDSFWRNCTVVNKQMQIAKKCPLNILGIILKLD